jgi:hypothetical protein
LPLTFVLCPLSVILRPENSTLIFLFYATLSYEDDSYRNLILESASTDEKNYEN